MDNETLGASIAMSRKILKDAQKPVKGVDYWTAEDKEEILRNVGAMSLVADYTPADMSVRLVFSSTPNN